MKRKSVENRKDENTALYWYKKAIRRKKKGLPKKLKTSAMKSIKELEAAGYSASQANFNIKIDI